MSNTGQLREAVERMHSGTATLDDIAASARLFVSHDVSLVENSGGR
jgi:hypothetical protein